MQIINNRFLSLYDYNFLIVNQMRKYWMWDEKGGGEGKGVMVGVYNDLQPTILPTPSPPITPPPSSSPPLIPTSPPT